MYCTIPSHLSELPIYKKALEIFSLSQKISCYMHYDLEPLTVDGKEDDNIYFTGDIIQQSVSLFPEIIKAELEHHSENKHRHALRVRSLSRKLFKNCLRLEKSKSNGKDFLPILRKELKLFNKLQRSWILTL